MLTRTGHPKAPQGERTGAANPTRPAAAASAASASCSYSVGAKSAVPFCYAWLRRSLTHTLGTRAAPPPRAPVSLHLPGRRILLRGSSTRLQSFRESSKKVSGGLDCALEVELFIAQTRQIGTNL